MKANDETIRFQFVLNYTVLSSKREGKVPQTDEKICSNPSVSVKLHDKHDRVF